MQIVQRFIARTGALLVTAACLLAPGTSATAQTSFPLPPQGSTAFAFHTTALNDPDAYSRRYDARLASDGQSTVVAGIEHILQRSTLPTTLPVELPVWSSTDRGATWSAQPGMIDAPTCAPGEYIGAGKPSAVPGAIYTLQNCATVNTVYVSRDGGRNWQPTRQPITGAGDDEGYITADPTDPSRLYAVTHILATDVHTIVVSKSTDGGDTFSQIIVNGRESASQAMNDSSNFYTPVLIDPRDSQHLYLFWIANTVASKPCQVPEGSEAVGTWHFMTTAFMATSTDGGSSWTEGQIQDVDPNAPPCLDPTDPTRDPHTIYHDVGNLFPDAALDAAGNPYLVYSEISPGMPLEQPSHVMLMASGDGGASFRTVRVDAGGLGANVNPSIVAGSDGRIDIAWEGSTASDEIDPNATWAVMLAQSANAHSPAPTFTQTRVSGLTHTGAICPVSCPTNGPDTPHVAEHGTVGLAADGCGDASVMWLEDSQGPESTNAEEIPTVATQTAGPTLTDHPAETCPGAAAAPTGAFVKAEHQTRTVSLPATGLSRSTLMWGVALLACAALLAAGVAGDPMRSTLFSHVPGPR